MSAIDEMEEQNQREAYQRGFAEGAKQERERLRVETENPLYWSIGRIQAANRDNKCIANELDGVLPRLRSISESLRQSQSQSTGGEQG
jgi:hypothetical protein